MKREPVEASVALALLGLRQPVQELTRQQLDERRVLGMWQQIERRSRGGAERRQGALSPPRLALAAALPLLLVLGWSLLRSTTLQAPSVPLVTAQGQRFESLEASNGSAASVSFADGSQIEAAPGTRVEGLAATASEFVVLL